MSFSSWRGVVGMVNPTMRPGMIEEVCRLLPEGIGLIPLYLNISRGTEDEFAGMMPHYEKQIAVLAEQKCIDGRNCWFWRLPDALSADEPLAWPEQHQRDLVQAQKESDELMARIRAKYVEGKVDSSQ